MTESKFRRWGAVYIIAALFLASWVGQLIAQSIEMSNEAREHGQAFQWSEFWPAYLSATLENWQSEFLQLVVQAVLIQSLLARSIFRASDQADKDDVDKILRAIRDR